MKIFHYRMSEYENNPWKDTIIKDDSQLEGLRSKTLVSINDQIIARQHSMTYLTGRETCHAHHFAKMVAGAILNGNYDQAPELNVSLPDDEMGSVLWVDSAHSIYSCADFFKEMTSRYDPEHKRFALLCLDKLGQFRYDFYAFIQTFEEAVKMTQPTLIVIDDIDHLMPNCGVNAAAAFDHAVRDILNHSDTACLFIGYNHLSKRASTPGNLGKYLFSSASSIFSVTTQQAVTTVRLVKSFMYQTNYDGQFSFTIGDDNLAHQVVKVCTEPHNSNIMQQTTLRDIISDVIEPGETISPDQLFQRINDRRQQLNRFDRTRALIAQAAQLGIITKAPNSNDYTLTGPPCRDTVTAPSPINNSLTLPPHPQPTPHQPVEEVQPTSGG